MSIFLSSLFDLLFFEGGASQSEITEVPTQSEITEEPVDSSTEGAQTDFLKDLGLEG